MRGIFFLQKGLMSEDRVELTYCEHCGGLWLRPAAAANICPRCIARQQDSAAATTSRKPYRNRRTK